MDFRPALAAACLLTTAVACTSHAKPARQTAHPTANAAAASASAAAAALADLQRQASLGSNLVFAATYEAEGTDPPRSGTVHVFHTADHLRLDVVENGATVRIIVDPSGTFSCKLGSGTKTPLCVTLAGPHKTVPPAVDPGLQHLFTSALTDIVDGQGLRVEPAPATSPGAPSSPQAGTGAASCYSVVAVPSGSDLSPGTYCFSNGVLTSARFRSSSLQLTKLEATPVAPVATAFKLPASPAPLSSESAGPSPSP